MKIFKQNYKKTVIEENSDIFDENFMRQIHHGFQTFAQAKLAHKIPAQTLTYITECRTQFAKNFGIV